MGYTSYRDSTLVFLHIHNIHAVRDSHRKLMALCGSTTLPSTKFLADVEDTGWLTHVRSVLEGGVRVASALHRWVWLCVFLRPFVGRSPIPSVLSAHVIRAAMVAMLLLQRHVGAHTLQRRMGQDFTGTCCMVGGG